MTLIKVLINWQKRTDAFWQLIEIFLKLKIPLLELLINWKVSKNFGQVIKYETFIIKTFDQLKNDNFDQLNFGQVIISHWCQYYKTNKTSFPSYLYIFNAQSVFLSSNLRMFLDPQFQLKRYKVLYIILFFMFFEHRKFL